VPTHAAPHRGYPWLRAIGRGVLRLLGWRIEGEIPNVPKFVAVVAPHTSNWDFFVGVFVMFALDLDVHWFGKDSLFKSVPGAILRKLGGRPVRRDAPEGVVAEMAAIVRAEPRFILAITPEGTRKRVAHWRTGFYRIAEAADVPILPVWLDWGRHVAGLGTLVRPTGDLAADIAALQALYRPSMARNPEGFW
jgi:1-acyl-sn-glycerol-3-phosphate acyltransferase